VSVNAYQPSKILGITAAVTGINKSGSFVINNNKAAAAGNALCKYF
jgi:hypothetical protein